MRAAIDISLDITDPVVLKLGSDVLRHLLSLSTSYEDGTGSGKIDEAWSGEYTVAAGGHDNHDLDFRR